MVIQLYYRAHARPRLAAMRDLLIICGTVSLIFSDQNLLAPNLSQAARSLGLDDAGRDELLGGGLAFGLFVVGGLAAVLAWQ